jgi:hypothetical protein
MCVALMFSAGGALALPNCQGSYSSVTWTNCFGTYTYTNGRKYVGEYRDGKFNGQGTYTWPNGRKYNGEFRDGKFNGQGTYTFANGDKYVFEWRDGKNNGQDLRPAQQRMIVPKPRPKTLQIPENQHIKKKRAMMSSLPDCQGNNVKLWNMCYGFITKPNLEGEFKNGQPFGWVKTTLKNGIIYEGKYSNGAANGFGFAQINNGDRYTGQFKNNEPHGSGEYTYANGNRINKIWEAGKVKEEAAKKSVLPLPSIFKNPTAVPQTLVVKIQMELIRIGCSASKPDGKIGPLTKSALFRFTQISGIEYSDTLFNDHGLLELVESFPSNTCTQSLQTSTPSAPKLNLQINELEQERRVLEANLLATQNMINQQNRINDRAYNACFSQCALNNKAGPGFMGALNGLNQCTSSCSPLKYGASSTPPSWDQDTRRLKTVRCMITRLSNNQATATCN